MILDWRKPEKYCSRCQTTKPGVEFYTRKIHKERYAALKLSAYCIPCTKSKSLEWQYASPENRRRHGESAKMYQRRRRATQS